LQRNPTREESDHVDCLDQSAGFRRSEMQCVDDLGQPMPSVTIGAGLAVDVQVFTVLALILLAEFVGDDERPLS
jgi:hypothetical protein